MIVDVWKPKYGELNGKKCSITLKQLLEYEKNNQRIWD